MNVTTKIQETTRLVVSGGGPRGLAVMGALHYCYDIGGLRKVTDYWGTSMGSIITLLLSVGYTPFEIFHKMYALDSLAPSDSIAHHNILETTSFCPVEILGNNIREMLRDKLGENTNPTFLELYTRFNNKINIIGSNATKMVGECFNVDTHPFMSVIDAVEISCDLPFIFNKKEYNGDVYVDGGLINNYPIDLADDGVHICLGVCVFGDIQSYGDGHIGWLYKLLHLPILELYRERVKKLGPNVVNVKLQIDNLSMFEMGPTNKKKIDVFSTGYRQCKEYIESQISRLEYVDSESSGDWEWDSDF